MYLFIYDSFYDAVIHLQYTALNVRTIAE